MIFIDSNIPAYLVGGEHPNKPVARRMLRASIADGEILVTDAEVLQEILHRYVTSDRHHLIGQAMSAVLDVVDEVFPIERADVDGRGASFARRASPRGMPSTSLSCNDEASTGS